MKKRILSLLCVFCLMLTMLPTSVFAAGYDAPTLSIEASYDSASNKVTAKVILGACSDLGTLDFHMKYDIDKLAVESIDGNEEFGNEDYTTISDNTATTKDIGLSFVKTSGMTVTGTKLVFTATFSVKPGQTGDAQFSFDDYYTNFAHKNGDDTASTPAAGSVTTTTVTIPKAPIASVSFTLADPAKGVALPSLNGLGSGYTGAVEWYKGNTATGAAVTGLAEGDQVYTAKVTLAADTSAGENFADSVTVPADYTKVSNDGTKLILTRTFDATAGADSLGGTVTIDNTNPKFDDTLTANTTGLTYGSETAGTLTYQWYRGDTAIPSATGNSYTTVAADVDKTIKVEVKNSNNSGSVTSAPTAAVAKKDYAGTAATAAVTDDAHRWDKKIEITNVTTGQEYAITAGSTEPTEGWRDDGVFNDLTSKTNYTVYTRVKATDTMAASTSVTTPVKTKKAMDPGAFDLSGLTSVYHYNGSAQNPSVSYKSGYSAATVGALTFKYEKNEGSYPPVSECKLPGAYRVTIVTDNTGSDYAAGESFVGVFSISRGNLTAANFQVTGLTTYDYDDSQKKATVTLKSGVDGVGAITVYYEGVAPTTYTRQTTAPTDAGSYKVSVNVATGDYYNDVNNLELGTLKINKVNYTGTMTFTETVRSGQVTNNKTLTLPALPDGANYGAPTVGGTTALISAQSVSGTTLTYSTTNQTDGTSATITIPVTGATNYNNYSIVVTVTAKDREDAGVSITTPPTSKTYGEANFTVTATKTASNGGTWNWTSSDDTVLKIVDGADSATATVQVLKASATGATLTVTYTSSTHYGSANATITVAQKEVTVAAGDYKVSKEYDGTTGIGTPSGALSVSGILTSDTVTVITAPVAYTDANVGGQSAMDVTISLVGTGNGNYKIKGGATTISVPCEITAKDVKLTGGINATDRSYVKDNKTVALTKGTLTFDGLVSGETLNVNIPATGTISDAKVGAYNVTYSGVTLKDGTGKASNYTLVGPLPTVTVNITKATAPTLTSIPVSQKYTVDTEQSKNIGNGGMPADAGTLTYTAGSPSVTTGTATVSSFTVDNTGMVKYTITGGADGAVINLPVTIGSDNYADATINVVITLTAKDNQAALTLTGGTTVVYGQTLQLGTSGGSGTGAVTYAVTNGTGEATIDATGKLTPVKVGTVKVTATKAGDASYNSITSAEVEITITRATPTGAPKYTAITTSGKTLADAGLTTAGSTLNPNAGTLVWVDNAGTVLPDTTAVAANTTYKWLFTPTDANYTTLTGSIELYHVSTGGGGGWYYTYYTIKATAGTNGSISPSGWTSVRDGRDQTFTITPDKGYAVAKVLVDGKSVGAVKSYTFKNVTKDHTIEAIFMKSNGNPQTGVFVDVAEGSYYEEAIDWAVEKGITNGVSSNMFAPNDPCTRAQIVTFLWRAAGSPAPKSMSSFTDVPADAFYAKAVAWAVENGITSGTGEGKFSPNSTCTRAQAVTFLYRASGSPAVSGKAEFSDVSTTAFYADAVAWAAKKGITTGIGGGLFGSDNDCTRGQIVTFLWRAMAE